MRALSALERRLINRYQGGFPLAARPFSQAAETLGCSEADLLNTLGRLMEQGWLSRFGPLYNAERMGGGLVLAALAAPAERFDAIAQQLNALPEVAHNYRREHRLNMWFVLATESPQGIAETTERIQSQTGLRVYSFPKLREFYLGLWLELDAKGGCRTRSFPVLSPDARSELDGLDYRIVQATQAGLPLTPEPYAHIARQAGCTAPQLLARMRAMLSNGVIRRIGVVPNHYQLGLRGNGMSVWDIPDGHVERVGALLGELDFVSHCYARPRHLPHWRYNLFAMVHGRGREQVSEKVAAMSRVLGTDSRGHQVLFSTAVLKKTGMRLAQ